MKTKRLIVGISGSSGALLGIRLLETLAETDVETHLIITPSARITIEQETSWTAGEVADLADVSYDYQDIGAKIASGSFQTHGMVVIPCSIKTLSAVANSYADNLLTRAADVTLKEGRPLVLAVRETPLHRGHIRLLKKAASAGAIICPPVPAFYTHLASIDDMASAFAERVLTRMGFVNGKRYSWSGISQESNPDARLIHEMLGLPTLTLATVGADGEPHAAPLNFAADDAGNLFFFSDPESRHGNDFSTAGHAAAAIYPPASHWREIKGLQIQGKVRLLRSGSEWEKAWDCYQNKFPYVKNLKEILDANSFFVLTPEWIRLLDNSRGFGYKQEVQSLSYPNG